MKIEISVTREDIDKGVPSDSVRCPVALAVKRALKPYPKIKLSGVDWRGLEMQIDPRGGFEGEAYLYSGIGKKMSAFVEKFDETGVVLGATKEEKAEAKAARAKLKPFAFVVKIPNHWFGLDEKGKREKSKK